MQIKMHLLFFLKAFISCQLDERKQLCSLFFIKFLETKHLRNAFVICFDIVLQCSLSIPMLKHDLRGNFQGLLLFLAEIESKARYRAGHQTAKIFPDVKTCIYVRFSVLLLTHLVNLEEPHIKQASGGIQWPHWYCTNHC